MLIVDPVLQVYKIISAFTTHLLIHVHCLFMAVAAAVRRYGNAVNIVIFAIAMLGRGEDHAESSAIRT